MTRPRRACVAALAVCLAQAGPATGAVRAGADLSFTPQLVSLGAVYRLDGTAVDLLDACATHGLEIVRLRLWHTPAEPWNGLDATVAFAREVKARGFDLMLDLHYSDTWADPGHQSKPAAWEGIPFEALVDSVREYTSAVVKRFRDEGILPEYIQIGNEISAGMLWDDGRVGWWGASGTRTRSGTASLRLSRRVWPASGMGPPVRREASRWPTSRA